MTGKSLTAIAALLATLGLASADAWAQAKEDVKPIRKEWTEPDKPGDGKVAVTVPDGDDPIGCRIEASVKAGCQKIMCKGEGEIFTTDRQGMQAAKRDALMDAKEHYVRFLKETVSSKETIERINAAVKKEGVPDAGVQAVSGRSVVRAGSTSAEAMIKGVVVVEDGIIIEKGQGYAYVIVGASCTSQAAADQMSAGNADKPAGQAQGGSGAGGAAAAPSGTDNMNERRRRASGNL